MYFKDFKWEFVGFPNQTTTLLYKPTQTELTIAYSIRLVENERASLFEVRTDLHIYQTIYTYIYTRVRSYTYKSALYIPHF